MPGGSWVTAMAPCLRNSVRPGKPQAAGCCQELQALTQPHSAATKHPGVGPYKLLRSHQAAASLSQAVGGMGVAHACAHACASHGCALHALHNLVHHSTCKQHHTAGQQKQLSYCAAQPLSLDPDKEMQCRIRLIIGTECTKANSRPAAGPNRAWLLHEYIRQYPTAVS